MYGLEFSVYPDYVMPSLRSMPHSLVCNPKGKAPWYPLTTIYSGQIPGHYGRSLSVFPVESALPACLLAALTATARKSEGQY